MDATTTYEAAEAWQPIMLSEVFKSFQRLNIGKPNGAGLYSIASNIIKDSNGELGKVVITFLYYLRFVDMGVGKGLTAGGVIDNKATRALAKKGLTNNAFHLRIPKKWYDRTLMHEVHRLNEIVLAITGDKVIKNMESNLGLARDTKGIRDISLNL